MKMIMTTKMIMKMMKMIMMLTIYTMMMMMIMTLTAMPNPYPGTLCRVTWWNSQAIRSPP